MDTRMIDKLIDKLANELEVLSRKTTTSTTDLDSMNKIIVCIEKLMRIEEIEGKGYSNSRGVYAGDWRTDSYGNRAEHYGYSRTDGMSSVKDNIRRMMDDSSMNSTDRRTLERAMEILA